MLLEINGMTGHRFFAPGLDSRLTSVGLFVLRAWLGVVILLVHGWPKFTGFSDMARTFPDVLGLGHPVVGLALATFAECVCSVLLAIGAGTRLMALVLVTNLSVAFVFGHNMKLSGPGNGELALVYLAGFVTLVIAGPGRYSVDRAIFGRR
jgi:putative oxidoreductase